jgi:hypothetical protein
MVFFFGRLAELVLASSQWFSSTLGGLAFFLAWIVGSTVILGLLLRWDSGARGAGWALVIALPILAACAGAAIWLAWFDGH